MFANVPFKSALLCIFAIAGLTALPQAALSAERVAAQRAMSRAQALQALTRAAPQDRAEGVLRLAQIGNDKDASKLVERLADQDSSVRELAEAALWQVWGRSGDAAIDAQYRRAMAQMSANQIEQAVQSFSKIIAKKPAFAEAWNKRATLYYMLGKYPQSMKDCDEVLKLNPNHFGALSGYAQMYIKQGDLEQAIGYYERALKVHPLMRDGMETLEFLRKQAQAKRESMI